MTATELPTPTTGELLYAAILAQPDDDTARLVYADYLDGLDMVRVTCPVPTCGNPAKGWDGFYRCRTCHGTGTVIDTSNRDRAELIRSQVWLWANPSCDGCTGPEWQQGKPCSECDHRERLRERCRELLAANRERWERVPCVKCDHGWVSTADTGRETRLHERRCEVCHGSGDAGGLTWSLARGYIGAVAGTRPRGAVAGTRPRVTFARGFPVVVEVPTLADAVDSSDVVCPECLGESDWARHDRDAGDVPGCMTCGNHGVVDAEPRPTTWLAAVVRHHPVEQVVPLNVEPLEAEGGYWWAGIAPDDLVPPDDGYPTREAAVSSLGLRLVAWARGFR